MSYPFQKIEKKWQKQWREEKVYEPNLVAPKNPFYNLMMFPYPSAEGLHVGNMYAFTGADIFGRFKRMQGYDVLEPIGLDGFGIHSENYAIKIGVHPALQAKVSEKNFYRQLEIIGNGFSWDERVETYNPDYYRWTQWVFVQLWKQGLAYRKKQSVNWCPSCKTVLADEQVVAGKCERCGTTAEKKELEQWFFRITKYADRLLKNLETIDWSERVKVAQRNWIGKSEGVEITFKLIDIPGQPDGKHEIKIFTTRPDTLFGATFMVISPELAKEWLGTGWQASESVKNYISDALTLRATSKEEEAVKEKTGVLSGINAINPANGEKIPVWVSDYVLAGYGTGAIMAVPAHDERDFDFAQKFNLPIQTVIRPFSKTRAFFVQRSLVDDWKEKLGHCEFQVTPTQDVEIFVADSELENFIHLGQTLLKQGPYYFSARGLQRLVVYKDKVFDIFNPGADEQAKRYGKGLGIPQNELEWSQAFIENGLLCNSREFDGLDSEKAKISIAKKIGAELKTQYRLRDWLISRQRYWGAPIPMIYCGICAEDRKGEHKDMPGWYAVPEKDLPVKLPYVEDFRPKGKGVSPLATVKEFYEVKCPACGAKARRETDVSDTFLDSAWYFLRYPSADIKDVPWDAARTKKWLPVNMYTGGAEHSVLHLLYSRFVAMAFKDAGLISMDEPCTQCRPHGLWWSEGAKMSKSKGNVVNPDEYIKMFGADALRAYLMFLAPFEYGGDFRDAGILGTVRFLDRVWKLCQDNLQIKKEKSESAIVRAAHKTVKKVTSDIESLHYNTAVSALMILLNLFEKSENLGREEILTFLKLLAPFAPHISEELWHALGHETSIHKEPWPAYDQKLVEEETVEFVIQINGRVRDIIPLSKGMSEEEVGALVRQREKVKKWIGKNTPQKVIFVPNRLINFIL